MQTLAKRASVTVQKLYVISALRTTSAAAFFGRGQADSMNNFYAIKTMKYKSP